MKTSAIEFYASISRKICAFGVVLTLAATSLPCRADDSNTNVIVGSIGAGQEAIAFVTDYGQPEPKYDGVLISQWLQIHTLVNPNHLSLSALMTVKQISPPDRLGITRFDLPINFSAFNTNSPDHAYVQLGRLSVSNDFIQCTFQGMERGRNGCLQMWANMNYEPDKQDIRARLTYETNSDSIIVIGPSLPFDSSNACYFLEGDALFNSDGATLHAELREQNAKYRIELTTPKGKHLKTIIGIVTNAVINTQWELKDDRDKIFKGDTFEAAFYVAYPGDTHTNAPVRNIFSRVPNRNH